MPTILYVEDNEYNAYALTKRLERRGFSVVVATDGEKGLEMAESITPDLILMDLALPRSTAWMSPESSKANRRPSRFRSSR